MNYMNYQSTLLLLFLLLLNTMKHFGEYLQRAILKEEWQPYYIDYGLLKERLRSFARRRKALRRLWTEHDVELPELHHVLASMNADSYVNLDQPDHAETERQLSVAERDELATLLLEQVDQVSELANHQMATIQESLRSSPSGISLNALSHSLLELFHFMVTNIVTLRQILLRYNAYAQTFDAHVLTEGDLQQQNQDLVVNSSTNLHSANDMEALTVWNLHKIADLESTLVLWYLSRQEYDELRLFSNNYQHFRWLLDKSLTSMERGGHFLWRDHLIATLRYYYVMGTRPLGLALEPKILILKGRHLKKQVKALVKWKDTQNFPTTSIRRYKMDPRNLWPLILNLVSCFLFMMNNCIIKPSSAYYVSDLGSSDALSGLLLGMAPWFALISAVGYSFWTNVNYKHPILFAGLFMVIGNTLYAVADSFQSLPLCLVGQAMQGLGAPEVINRRYVADATPFEVRTTASAAFCLCTALGAALGPAMAILLDRIHWNFNLYGITVRVNGMTGPGYFMTILWFLYTTVILFTFREPNRLGLEELRQREAEQVWTTQETKNAKTAPSNDEDDDDDATSMDSTADLSMSSSLSLPTNNTNSPLYCIKHMTKAATLCMAVMFFKRIALESIVGSTSIITKNRYGWTISNVALLHFVNGLIVIPVSVLAGWLSHRHKDRLLTFWFLGITVFGMMIMVDVTDFFYTDNDTYNKGKPLAVGPTRYIAASLIAFSGIEACESFVASLVSKFVPSALAVGTFDSGLLSVCHVCVCVCMCMCVCMCVYYVYVYVCLRACVCTG
jgi:hypothetical protein